MHLSLFNLALQIVNFLVLAWLLQRFLFLPARAVLAKRREKMEALAREASEMKAEAARTIADCRAQSARMATDADAARRHAQATGEEEAHRLRDEATRQATGEVARAKKVIEWERREALAALEARAAELATSIAERVVRDVLTDDAPFLWRVTAMVEALHEAEKAAIASQLTQDIVRLTSSRPLDDATRARFERWLDDLAGQKIQASYVVDPSLVAGVELTIPTGTWRAHVRASIERIRADLVGHEHAA